ncbi:MAG: hypothetical protein LBD46_00565 [Endomicrobium sp.]|jgi:hypothetical protein|nr:hypothetical protein [Endomicrobium sp.]
MLKLPDVTIAALACTHVYETVQALKYSMKCVEFGDAVLISYKKPFYLPAGIRFEYTSKNKSIIEFNHKILYELHKYVHTNFVLLVHYDGFVINPDMWRKEFLDYDYTGSPWPKLKSLKDIKGNICRVGNSVSLRSKKLLELPSKIKMPFEKAHNGTYNEDLIVCVSKRHIFEEHGMRIAPLEIAKYFGHEAVIPETKGIRPFAFHAYFGKNFKNKRFGRVWLKYIFMNKPFYMLRRTFLKPLIEKIRKKYDVLTKYK